MISENIINFKTTELVEKIKNGEVSSKALCEVYINRIEKFEKKVCAWAFFVFIHTLIANFNLDIAIKKINK